MVSLDGDDTYDVKRSSVVVIARNGEGQNRSVPMTHEETRRTVARGGKANEWGKCR
jgi:hypothetical protein